MMCSGVGLMYTSTRISSMARSVRLWLETLGTGCESHPDRMFVIEVAHIPWSKLCGLCSDACDTVHHREPHLIRVGYCPELALLERYNHYCGESDVKQYIHSPTHHPISLVDAMCVQTIDFSALFDHTPTELSQISI